MKIRSGDNIVVIAGKNKGKTGKVVRVLNKTDRLVVEGVNKVKRHVRKTAQRPGQIIEFESPIHVSNVMIVDPKSKKRSRIGHSNETGKKKQRIAKNSKSTL